MYILKLFKPHVVHYYATFLLLVTCVTHSGYYCTGGSEEADPVAQLYGDECTVGHYCPNGTHTPEACPPGSFLNSRAMGSLEDCIPCTAGTVLYLS